MEPPMLKRMKYVRAWGNSSKAQYDTLHPDLQWLLDTVLEEVADISILKGHRDEAEQNAAYDSGHSKLRWPNGNHNKMPSVAVDIQPYPLPERREKLWAALAYIAGRAIEIGKRRGLNIRWGGDWDQDGDLTDQNFDDLYHLELKGN